MAHVNVYYCRQELVYQSLGDIRRRRIVSEFKSVKVDAMTLPFFLSLHIIFDANVMPVDQFLDDPYLAGFACKKGVEFLLFFATLDTFGSQGNTRL